MAEVDRRGFLRIWRRAEPTQGTEEGAEPSAKELQIRELADLTSALLADVDAQDEEQLAEGTLLTVPYDLAYMRVTSEHVVFSIVTGFSAILSASDVRGFDTLPPVEAEGYGNLLQGLLRAHHPADLEHITRSYGFRFREDSPLLAAIRTACDIPEPTEESEETTGAEAAGEPSGRDRSPA